MVQTELTLDDLEQMPDDFVHRELVNGELIELPPPERKHSEKAHNIYDSLSPFVKRHRLGRMFIGSGLQGHSGQAQLDSTGRLLREQEAAGRG